MIILSAILIGFLLLAVFLINSLYSDLEDINSSNKKSNLSYSNVENNLLNASKKYYRKHKNVYIITTDDLLEENFITTNELIPQNESSPCDGYVEIDEDSSFQAYISCTNYETEGY